MIEPLTLAGFPVTYPRVYEMRDNVHNPQALAAAMGYFNPVSTVLQKSSAFLGLFKDKKITYSR